MKRALWLIGALIIIIFNTSYAQVKVYAHRGGRALWPENTIYAYKQAIKYNIDYIDMDVVLTKDDQLVVHHDLSLNPEITKTFIGDWITKNLYINQLTVAQIKQYKVGEKKRNTLYKKQFPYQQSIKNLSIPTLHEVVSWAKKTKANSLGYQIELKNDAKSIDHTSEVKLYAKNLYKVLQSEGIKDRTEIQAFDFALLNALYKLDSSLKLAFLTTKNYKLKVWGGGFHLKKDEHISELIYRLHGKLWEPAANEVTAKDVIKAHSLGLKVVVWGLPSALKFEKKRIKELVKMGVDGIITDRPNLADYIKKIN